MVIRRSLRRSREDVEQRGQGKRLGFSPSHLPAKAPQATIAAASAPTSRMMVGRMNMMSSVPNLALAGRPESRADVWQLMTEVIGTPSRAISAVGLGSYLRAAPFDQRQPRSNFFTSRCGNRWG